MWRNVNRIPENNCISVIYSSVVRWWIVFFCLSRLTRYLLFRSLCECVCETSNFSILHLRISLLHWAYTTFFLLMPRKSHWNKSYLLKPHRWHIWTKSKNKMPIKSILCVMFLLVCPGIGRCSYNHNPFDCTPFCHYYGFKPTVNPFNIYMSWSIALRWKGYIINDRAIAKASRRVSPLFILFIVVDVRQLNESKRNLWK